MGQRVGLLSHMEDKIHRAKDKKVLSGSPQEYGDSSFYDGRLRPPQTSMKSHFVESLKRESRPVSFLTFDWAIISFAIGIAVYFFLPFEPKLISLLVPIIFVFMIWLGLSIAVKRGSQIKNIDQFLLISLMLLCVCLGAFRAAHHTKIQATPFLPEARSAYSLTGWVEGVETSGRGFRWRLRISEIENRFGDPVFPGPKRVRVRANIGDIKIGQAVRLKALMTAPPGPVMPGGYDPARRAYFQGIGGYGFAISDPEIISAGPLNFDEKIARTIAQFRYGLADRVLTKASEKTAGLQTALLTGVRSYIPPEQTTALRDTGLAHVLAISGLHMGLLSGGGYFLLAFILALISPLSRRYDVRKFASCFGMMLATIYLIISGAGVSTQRAYIMAMIVFLAVIMDRRAFSMRSVSVAALITLVLHPEGLISAGFQMSFSAAAALVAFYRFWQNFKPPPNPRDFNANIFARLGRNIKRNLGAVTTTSFIAGGATGGFAMLHFNRIANYGMIGNVIAMPVFSALVMPAALMVFLLMPFGWEGPALKVMGLSLDFILYTANAVADLKGSVSHIRSAPGFVIGLYGLGFAGLCIGAIRMKAVSLGVLSVCMLIWALAPQPDVRISDTGQVAFWDKPTDTLFVGRVRTDRFGREQFMQRAGKADAQTRTYVDTRALCDSLACRFELKGKTISVVSQPDVLEEECANSDLVVLTTRRAGPRLRRLCAAKLRDGRDFLETGAADIYISQNRQDDLDIRIAVSNTPARQARPWARGWAEHERKNRAQPLRRHQ